MQEQLRRFAHRTYKQEEGKKICRVPLCPEEADLRLCQCRRCCEDVIKIDAVDKVEQPENTKRKTKVAHTVDHKSFDRCGIGTWLTIVKSNEKIRGNADPFPAKEHLDEVVCSHQHKHREGEKRKIRKEARAIALAFFPVLVMSHVAHRIQMHER